MEVVAVIKEMALEYPNLDLKELVTLKAQECIDDLIKKQISIIDKIRKYAKENIKDEASLKNIEAILDEHQKRARGESKEEFANKRLIYALKNSDCKSQYKDEMVEIARTLPTSNNDIFSFFVKYSKPEYNSYTVAEKLVKGNIATTEHIVPRSNNGGNKLENYICDCADCNSRRSSTPFDIWQEDIDNFESNLQNYLEEVQSAIDDTSLDIDYLAYIERIIPVISKLSNKKIKLKLPDTSNAEIMQKALTKRKEKAKRIFEQEENLNKKIAALKKEIEEIEAYPQYRRIAQGETIAKKIADTQREIDSRKETCAELKSSKQPNKKAEKRIKKLQQKLEYLLHKQNIINHQTLTLEKNNEKIKTLKDIMEAIKQINLAKSDLEKAESQEDELKTKIADLQKRIEELQSTNNSIRQKENFNPDNKTSYYKYQHLIELLQVARKMYKEVSSKNKRGTKEVIIIAQQALQDDIDELLKDDNVTYHINQKSISRRQGTLNSLQKKLNEIFATKRLLNAKIVELSKVSNGESFEKVQEDYRNALEESNILRKIYSVSKKRQELEILENIKEYNSTLLPKLQEINTMSNEEFKQLISSFYYEIQDF